MENAIDTAVRWFRDAKTLKTIKLRMQDKKRNNPDIDKSGIGFNKDKRFSMFSAEVSFDAWIGHYGSSSCSTFMGFNNKDKVVEAFYHVIERHENEILEWMSDYLVEQAKSLKNLIEEEQRTKLLALQELEKELEQ